MHIRPRSLAFASSALVAVLAACGEDEPSSASPTSSSTCEADAGGCVSSDDGGLATTPLPDACDPARSLAESPACIADELGIFVSEAGNDANAGSKAAPVKTIQHGLELASVRTLGRLYVAAGDYPENVSVTIPVTIHGGLDAAFMPAPMRAVVAPRWGTAFRIVGVAGAVRIEDVAATGVVAAPGSGLDRGSAVSVFVAESSDVTLARMDIVAGPGDEGLGGGRGFARSVPDPGRSAEGATGGNGMGCFCNGQYYSGAGRGADGDGTRIKGGSSIPSVGVPNAGTSSATTCTNGGDGANGGPGGKGAPVTVAGELTREGWITAHGSSPAPDGYPGQGGGGGGAKTALNLGGGGGTCGGCGGFGGSPGHNGDSSFALLSVSSTVTVVDSRLASGNAGRGGAGGNGSEGGAGGAGGAGACAGGRGGYGAGGSGGSGGLGGNSAAVAYRGAEPTLRDVRLTIGTAGEGGAAGAPGGGVGSATGAAGVAGTAGVARELLSL